MVNSGCTHLNRVDLSSDRTLSVANKYFNFLRTNLVNLGYPLNYAIGVNLHPRRLAAQIESECIVFWVSCNYGISIFLILCRTSHRCRDNLWRRVDSSHSQGKFLPHINPVSISQSYCNCMRANLSTQWLPAQSPRLGINHHPIRCFIQAP